MNIFNKALNEIQTNEAYKDFIDNLPEYIKFCSMVAKAERAYFDELIKEGFSEDQATKLVAAHGLFPGRTDRSPNQESDN